MGWINVQEQEPDGSELVRVRERFYGYEYGLIDLGTWFCVSEDALRFTDDCSVTHWMLIPEPMEEEL